MGKKKGIQMQRWVGQVRTNWHDRLENQLIGIEILMDTIGPAAVDGYAEMGRGLIFCPVGVTPGAELEMKKQSDYPEQFSDGSQITMMYMPLQTFLDLIAIHQEGQQDMYKMPAQAIETVKKRVTEYTPAKQVVIVVYRTDGGLNTYVCSLD